jgi:hypothetical protein
MRHNHNKQRGALRHWLIGCGIFVVLIVALICGGVYMVYRKVGPKTFSVASKVDPGIDATRDEVLPPKVGSFTRTENEAQDFGGSDVNTSFALAAVYEETGSGNTATVMAVKTADSNKIGGQNNPFAQFNTQAKQNQPSDMGFTMKIPWGPVKAEFALWAKKNWTYTVTTTSTSALKFAEMFEPKAEEKK